MSALKSGYTTAENCSYTDDARSTIEDEFVRAYPSYASTQVLDELRASDYARLDRQQQVYLDYTGGGLYATSQLRQHMALLEEHVFGNPHSLNPTSLAMTHLIDQTRAFVLDYFNAAADEYDLIFTLNASGALKLLGEAYPFGPGAHYVLTTDNHNSVNGIREFARHKGATFTYVPVIAPELRLDEAALREALAVDAPGAHKLLAYPAQSNFTGVQHPLEWIAEAQKQGWDVLLDAAAYVPCNRLDLSEVHPDFVSLSFYKVFGYPTGVGALICRKSALRKLQRPWFAGGTIAIASVKGDGFFFVDGSAAFEDGTINYLNLPAVETGLRHITSIGIDVIHERVRCLTGWLLEQMTAMRHTNGRPIVRIFGPNTNDRRGCTIAFNIFDTEGVMVSDRRIEELANDENISLRTGCFCNPGAGEIAHGITAQDMRDVFDAGIPMSFADLNEFLRPRGKGVSAVRISTGLATNFNDVYRFMQFVAALRDKTAEELGYSLIPTGDQMHPDAA